TQVRRDEFGVWKLWEELSKRYPSYEFRFGYGLGIVAIGEKAQDFLLYYKNTTKISRCSLNCRGRSFLF
ncbi:MAG: hypothetical protein QW609_04725, partial [Candidatus Aenigmatarchaeota archaeon]